MAPGVSTCGGMQGGLEGPCPRVLTPGAVLGASDRARTKVERPRPPVGAREWSEVEQESQSARLAPIRASDPRP